MAEKKVISIEVEGTGKAINSIKELKAELKAAQSAALNGDGKAAKRVAELKDKMDDLKDTTKSLQGSGVEKISSGFSMLGQGFKDFDFDKIKTGFKGLGSAMSAIPIFLIIEGISYLVQNFDELSKGSGFLATILRSVSDAISWLVDGFTDLIGVTSESSRAIEDQGEAMVKANEKSQEALQGTTSEFDRQLAVAKAAGKSTIEIEKAKQQAIIDTNFQIAKGIEAQVRAGGEFTDEMKKQLSGSLEAIKNAKVKEYEITKEDDKAKASKYKEYLDKQKELRDKAETQRLLDLQKAKEDEAAIELQSQQAINADKVVNEQYTQDEINAIKAAARAKEYEDTEAEKKRKKDQKDADLIDDIDGINKKLEYTKQGLQAGQNISDIFFAVKMAKVKKGSKEEEDLARKQFNINKAFSISSTILNGIQGGLTAFAKNPPPSPIGIISAGLVGLGTAAAVAKIASTQFQSSGGGGAPSISAGSSTSSPSMPDNNGTPSIAAPQQNTTTFTGNNNNNFNQPPIKTYVVETDLRNSTNTIDKIKDQATF
jgi:hypothetical protein